MDSVNFMQSSVKSHPLWVINQHFLSFMVLNRSYLSFNAGPLETTYTVPLKSPFKHEYHLFIFLVNEKRGAIKQLSSKTFQNQYLLKLGR